MAFSNDDKKLHMIKGDETLTNDQPLSIVQEGTVLELKNGTTTDDNDDTILRINGHEAVLERRFSWISALGLAFSITNSWIGYLVCYQNVVPSN